MANTSAAKKAFRVSQKKEATNKARKNRIRSFIRKLEDNIKSKDEKESRVSFKNLEKEIMKGVTKGIFKLNTASRKLRRLAQSIRNIKALAPAKEEVVAKKEVKKTVTKTEAKKAPVKKAPVKKVAAKKE